jgi:hypothetical protein
MAQVPTVTLEKAAAAASPMAARCTRPPALPEWTKHIVASLAPDMITAPTFAQNGAHGKGVTARPRRPCQLLGARAGLRHSDTARIGSFDVNVPFMQLERHEWDIHAV